MGTSTLPGLKPEGTGGTEQGEALAPTADTFFREPRLGPRRARSRLIRGAGLATRPEHIVVFDRFDDSLRALLPAEIDTVNTGEV